MVLFFHRIERGKRMPDRASMTVLTALSLMFAFATTSGVLLPALASDGPPRLSDEIRSEGVKVAPVAHATVSMMALARYEASLAKDRVGPPAPQAAPWVPIPRDIAGGLPVPPGLGDLEGRPVGSEEGLSPFTTGRAAPELAESFDGLHDNGGGIPPDTHGAAGPDHLMITLNTEVRIQNKSGDVLSTVGLETFWQALGIRNAFDPKVIYDPLSERFLFVACAESRAPDSSMLLGISRTSDPTGNWDLWQFDGDGADNNWVDYPNIGVNKNWITFTSNMFTISSDFFRGVNIWAVNKADALEGIPFAELFYEQGVGFTLVPCHTYSSEEEIQYLINTWNSSSGRLRIHKITGTPGDPAFLSTSLYPVSSGWALNFPPLFPWPDAPQLGSTQAIETNDDRMMNAVLRNGSLWCTHTIALPSTDPTRTAAKWWEIDPTDGSVHQTGVIEDTVTGMFYYFPSIAVNRYDEVLIGFTGSSPSTYAGGYYTYRDPSMPKRTMGPVTLLKAGEAPYYKTYGGAENRWGDYSATCVDPEDDTSLWTIQEYADTPTNTWGTWWGKLTSVPNYGDLAPFGTGDGDGEAADVIVSANLLLSGMNFTERESRRLDVAPIRFCSGSGPPYSGIPDPDGVIDEYDLAVILQAASGYMAIVPSCP